MYRTPGRSLRGIAEELGIALDTLRRLVVRVEIDAGEREELNTEHQAELSRLKRENRVPTRNATFKDRGLLREGGTTEPAVVSRTMRRGTAGSSLKPRPFLPTTAPRS